MFPHEITDSLPDIDFKSRIDLFVFFRIEFAKQSIVAPATATSSASSSAADDREGAEMRGLRTPEPPILEPIWTDGVSDNEPGRNGNDVGRINEGFYVRSTGQEPKELRVGGDVSVAGAQQLALDPNNISRGKFPIEIISLQSDPYF